MENKKYELGLWSGSGYTLDTFGVKATNDEEALEKTITYIIDKEYTGLYVTEDEIKKLKAQDEKDGIKIDDSWEENNNLIYVDATMEGAKFPVYIRSENMEISIVNEFSKEIEIVEEKTEEKNIEDNIKNTVPKAHLMNVKGNINNLDECGEILRTKNQFNYPEEALAIDYRNNQFAVFDGMARRTSESNSKNATHKQVRERIRILLQQGYTEADMGYGQIDYRLYLPEFKKELAAKMKAKKALETERAGQDRPEHSRPHFMKPLWLEKEPEIHDNNISIAVAKNIFEKLSDAGIKVSTDRKEFYKILENGEKLNKMADDIETIKKLGEALKEKQKENETLKKNVTKTVLKDIADKLEQVNEFIPEFNKENRDSVLWLKDENSDMTGFGITKTYAEEYPVKETVKGTLEHEIDIKGFEKWHEYDANGNKIYFKDSNGNEQWFEYDDKGNKIHFKNSDGYENWWEYDENGNEVHYWNSNGETWLEYDDNGNEIHYRNSNGDEIWCEYDEKGNEIHFKNSNGYERWHEYDDKGNEIHRKDSDGLEEWSEYDDKGNEIHFKDSDGYERWSEYDEKGNKIHFKDSDGYEKWHEYDDKGNAIHFKDSKGNERWHEYDEKGNEIHYKNSNGDERWHEYDEKGNKVHSKDSKGNEMWTDRSQKDVKIRNIETAKQKTPHIKFVGLDQPSKNGEMAFDEIYDFEAMELDDHSEKNHGVPLYSIEKDVLRFKDDFINVVKENLQNKYDTLEQKNNRLVLSLAGKEKSDETQKNLSESADTIAEDFRNLDRSLRFNANFEIPSEKLGADVSVFPGSTGKSGMGIRHLIEERYRNDKLSQEQITALTALVLDCVRNGEITRDGENRCEITRGGIVAIVRKDFDDEEKNWILTGFAYNEKSDKEKNREATEAIQTVIAKYGQSPDYSYFRSQVGAVISSLDSNITWEDSLVNRKTPRLMRAITEESLRDEKNKPFLRKICDALEANGFEMKCGDKSFQYSYEADGDTFNISTVFADNAESLVNSLVKDMENFNPEKFVHGLIEKERRHSVTGNDYANEDLKNIAELIQKDMQKTLPALSEIRNEVMYGKDLYADLRTVVRAYAGENYDAIKICDDYEPELYAKKGQWEMTKGGYDRPWQIYFTDKDGVKSEFCMMKKGIEENFVTISNYQYVRDSGLSPFKALSVLKEEYSKIGNAEFNQLEPPSKKDYQKHLDAEMYGMVGFTGDWNEDGRFIYSEDKIMNATGEPDEGLLGEIKDILNNSNMPVIGDLAEEIAYNICAKIQNFIYGFEMGDRTFDSNHWSLVVDGRNSTDEEKIRIVFEESIRDALKENNILTEDFEDAYDELTDAATDFWRENRFQQFKKDMMPEINYSVRKDKIGGCVITDLGTGRDVYLQPGGEANHMIDDYKKGNISDSELSEYFNETESMTPYFMRTININGITEDDYEKYLNQSLEDNYNPEDLIENYKFLEGHEQEGHKLTLEDIETAAFSGTFGSLIRNNDPVQFSLGYDEYIREYLPERDKENIEEIAGILSNNDLEAIVDHDQKEISINVLDENGTSVNIATISYDDSADLAEKISMLNNDFSKKDFINDNKGDGLKYGDYEVSWDNERNLNTFDEVCDNMSLDAESVAQHITRYHGMQVLTKDFLENYIYRLYGVEYGLDREEYTKNISDDCTKNFDPLMKLAEGCGFSGEDMANIFAGYFGNQIYTKDFMKDFLHNTMELEENKEKEEELSHLADFVSDSLMDAAEEIKRQAQTVYFMKQIPFEKLNIGKVSDYQIEEAKRAGKDISGYSHEITSDFIAHTIKKHGNAIAESARGNVAITDRDLKSIGSLLESPDRVVYGTTYKDFVSGNMVDRDRIVYAKNMGDGTSIYFEEVLTGGKNKKLRGTTLFKHAKPVSDETLKNIIKGNGERANVDEMKIMVREDAAISSTKQRPNAGAEAISASREPDKSITDFIDKSIQNYVNAKNSEMFVENGRTYGIAIGDKILLNPDEFPFLSENGIDERSAKSSDAVRMLTEVLPHEWTHIWDEYTMRANPELWNKWLEIAKETRGFDRILHSPEYKADIEACATEKEKMDYVASELHARMSGKFGQRILERIVREDGELTKKHMKRWMYEAGQYIAEEMGLVNDMGFITEEIPDAKEILSDAKKLEASTVNWDVVSLSNNSSRYRHLVSDFAKNDLIGKTENECMAIAEALKVTLEAEREESQIVLKKMLANPMKDLTGGKQITKLSVTSKFMEKKLDDVFTPSELQKDGLNDQLKPKAERAKTLTFPLRNGRKFKITHDKNNSCSFHLYDKVKKEYKEIANPVKIKGNPSWKKEVSSIAAARIIDAGGLPVEMLDDFELKKSSRTATKNPGICTVKEFNDFFKTKYMDSAQMVRETGVQSLERAMKTIAQSIMLNDWEKKSNMSLKTIETEKSNEMSSLARKKASDVVHGNYKGSTYKNAFMCFVDGANKIVGIPMFESEAVSIAKQKLAEKLKAKSVDIKHGIIMAALGKAMSKPQAQLEMQNVQQQKQSQTRGL